MNDRTDKLTADESGVFEYLKHWPGQFVSKVEIARRAESKSRFLSDPNPVALAKPPKTLAKETGKRAFTLAEVKQLHDNGHRRWRG